MHLRRKGFWCSTWMIFKQKERKGMELLVNIVVMLFFIGLFGCCADFAVFVVFVVSSISQPPLSSYAYTGRPAVGMMISAAEARALTLDCTVCVCRVGAATDSINI